MTQIRLGNSSLRNWPKSQRDRAIWTCPSSKLWKGWRDPRAAAPSRPSLGRASGPRPHSGTLTFFRGCHFIIFVQPICGTSRCWLGAGGRCRAAATPSHAACLPPPNSFPYSPRRERAQRVQSFRLQFSEVSPNQEHAPHGARKSQQQPEYSSQSGAFSPRASARKRSLQ